MKTRKYIYIYGTERPCGQCDVAALWMSEDGVTVALQVAPGPQPFLKVSVSLQTLPLTVRGWHPTFPEDVLCPCFGVSN